VETVTYQVSDGVGWVTLDRPEVMNAFDKRMLDELSTIWRDARGDDDVRCLVLTGAGDRAFCAGGDLKEMASTGLTVPPPDFLPQFGRTVQVDKPTIAAVNGIAYGGGFLLAQGCDLVVAAEHARFAISEAKVGRGSPWAAPLPWLIPPRIAMEILLTGDPIDAARAREVGLVNHVVPAADLVVRTQALARRIADNAPLSVRAAKATVRLVAEAPLSEAYDRAEEIWAPVYRSRDAQEGPRAFAEKRPPRWEGA
jgi:enoyl-CoA hydratase/carnithine racemase